jgi:hypothetical protein
LRITGGRHVGGLRSYPERWRLHDYPTVKMRMMEMPPVPPVPSVEATVEPAVAKTSPVESPMEPTRAAARKGDRDNPYNE